MNILALTITIVPQWWMLLAVITVAWGIYALVMDIKYGGWSGWLILPIYGMFWLIANLVMWLIYFIIN